MVLHTYTSSGVSLEQCNSAPGSDEMCRFYTRTRVLAWSVGSPSSGEQPLVRMRVADRQCASLESGPRSFRRYREARTFAPWFPGWLPAGDSALPSLQLRSTRRVAGPRQGLLCSRDRALACITVCLHRLNLLSVIFCEWCMHALVYDCMQCAVRVSNCIFVGGLFMLFWI